MPVINEVEIRGIVVGVFQENCYIVASPKTKEAIAIDAGDEPDRILDLAKDMGVQVKLIATSHAHHDHIWAVKDVKEKTGAQFLLHSFDVPLLDTGAKMRAQMLGSSEELPPQPDRFVSDGDIVSVAGLDLRVIHTPGHSPGSVSYYVNGLLFSGDTLFRGSIGRTDTQGGNYQQIMNGIINKLLELPDETIVLPGHQLETTIRQERFTNPFILHELESKKDREK